MGSIHPFTHFPSKLTHYSQIFTHFPLKLTHSSPTFPQNSPIHFSPIPPSGSPEIQSRFVSSPTFL